MATFNNKTRPNSSGGSRVIIPSGSPKGGIRPGTFKVTPHQHPPFPAVRVKDNPNDSPRQEAAQRRAGIKT